MRKELDFEEAFAKWGEPGEEFDDDWYEAFAETIHEEGQLLAKHEWCGAYAGETVVRLFRGLYISEDEVDICGPYETFKEAADAVNFFHVTTATTKIWVDPEILSTLELPSTLSTSPMISVGPSETRAQPPQAQSSTTQLNEHEKAWASGMEALDARLEASGLKVRKRKPATDTQPLVATFHSRSGSKLRPVEPPPSDKPVKK